MLQWDGHGNIGNIRQQPARRECARRWAFEFAESDRVCATQIQSLRQRHCHALTHAARIPPCLLPSPPSLPPLLAHPPSPGIMYSSSPSGFPPRSLWPRPSLAAGARDKNGAVDIFNDFRFQSQSYEVLGYHFRSIDTWLGGICKSFCPEHKLGSVACRRRPHTSPCASVPTPKATSQHALGMQHHSNSALVRPPAGSNMSKTPTGGSRRPSSKHASQRGRGNFLEL